MAGRCLNCDSMGFGSLSVMNGGEVSELQFHGIWEFECDEWRGIGDRRE